MANRMLHLFIVFLPITLFGANDPQISLSKVTPEGGVAYTQITSIVEDNHGKIWFSTNNGLFSYNSINIKRYRHFRRNSTISSNRINTLYKDNSGKLWVATANGLCSYNDKSDDFIRYNITNDHNDVVGKNISSFFQDDSGTYWMADENGIATFDPETKKAKYKNKKKKDARINVATLSADQTIWVFYNDGDIYYLTKDSQVFQYFKTGFDSTVSAVLIEEEVIWIGYQSIGLVRMNKKDGSITHRFNSKAMGERLPGDRIRSLIKDEENQIWVATNNGIAIIQNNKVKLIIEKQKNYELPHHSIYSLYQDSNKNIWIGTWLGGLAFHNKYNTAFQHYTQSTSNQSLNSNIVSCFAQVPNSYNLVIGTDNGELNLYNPKTNVFTTMPVVCDGDIIKRFKSITYDKFGTLWVGTYNNGVLYQKKNTKAFKKLIPPFNTGFQDFNLLATNDGLWVSNYPIGVYFYNFEDQTFIQYQKKDLDLNSISSNKVTHIIEDRKENIWFATKNGLNLLKKGMTQFKRFFQQEQNPESISSSYINCIFEDHLGFLWLGTNEGLNKFNPITGASKTYGVDDELTRSEIFSIIQDKDKNFWVTTENGLSKFNPDSEISYSFNRVKGIENNQFYPRAVLKSNTGELYFGGSNGFIKFQPNRIVTNPIPPVTTITQLYIHNKKILPDAEDGILKNNIGDTESITLNYKQNSIRFEFITNNYINPQKNIFKYRLKGFDNQWIQSNYNGRSTFTNVPPGDYIFEVKASNNDGVWNTSPTQIFIKITPPIWLTWYAYFVYFLILSASIYFFRKQIIYRQKLKNEVNLAKIQHESEEKLHQMKLQFFTNISHEFRTPLTLIQGPVSRLLKTSETENEFTNKQLRLIKNNTDRLLRLINQFLDFRRIDHGKLKLNPIKTDIVMFCKNVFNCFEEHANHRNFSYVFKSDFNSLKIDFDTDKFDKVLVNIISNAFKYSSDNGSIILKIQDSNQTDFYPNWNEHSIGKPLEDDFIEISIADSGEGISAHELPNIFERYFQIGNNHLNGTGIGLSLSTNYILMHNGQLIVSTFKGKGSVFCIRLPRHQHGAFNDPTEEPSIGTTFDFTSEPLTSLANKNKFDNNDEHQESLILIAEDNPELLEYLCDSLGRHFRIAKAKNGKEALNQINSLYPDLVVSDIMMPEIDGIELCSKIKKDIRISHIPVLLLTALNDVKDRISAINSGADAYLAKPFDDDLLIVQINNLLNSRKLLRESFSTSNTNWAESRDIEDLDKKLLLKAIRIIEENIANAEFTVEDLAEKLFLSRTHLHRKLKSLTNQSATEFIRSIRLKRAVELMKEGNLKVNEIGFSVGFNSHNYFTKTFKKQYGKSPSEFMKENFRAVED